MKRNNIILILIIIVIIVGAAVAFTLYEQQQVKVHLNKANAYHSQMMSYNPQITSSNVKEEVSALEKTKPILSNELNELRMANTMFASTTQKDYINAVIKVNTDNSKIFDIDMAMTKTTNLGELINYRSRINDINKDVATSANTRDSIVAAHPEEFGFEVVKL